MRFLDRTVPAGPSDNKDAHRGAGKIGYLRESQASGRVQRIGLEGSTKRGRSTTTLHILGGFELRLDGQAVLLPMRVKRLLAFLALHQHPLDRPYVSQSLWLDATERHANGNLRSALWKVGQLGTSVIDFSGGQLALSPTVVVDYLRSVRLAHRLISDPPSVDEARLDEGALTEDLLPHWYEDWVLAERERYRQLRLHALEFLCLHLVSLGRVGDAVQAGLAAVAGEPLRESATLVLMRAYVAEGNIAEAIRHFRWYESLLWDELRVVPSAPTRELIEALRNQ